MKKLIILILSVLFVISITGCSTAKVETKPVTIENEPGDSADQLSKGTANPSLTPSAASTTSPTVSAVPSTDSTVPSAESTAPSTDSAIQSSDSTAPDSASVTPSVDSVSAATEADKTKESTASPSEGPDLIPSPGPDAPGTSSELNGTISDKAYKAVIELEGTEETVNYKTYHSNLGFQMAFDIDRFSIVSTQFDDGNWKDSFVAENSNPDLYPYVYITVLRGHYLPSILPEGKNVTVSPEFEDEDDIHYIKVKDDKGVVISAVGLKETDELIVQDTLQLGDNKAYHYVVKEGDYWNSMIREDYFLVIKDYVYIISANYFQEASEGYGARMRAMINTITFD